MSGVPDVGNPFEPAGVQWKRVSGKLAVLRRLITCGSLGLIAIGALAAALLSGVGWLAVAVPVALLLASWAWWTIGRQVSAWGYAERDDDLLVRHGLLWREIVVVPYGRMQYVDVQAGPVDRAFGIARVQLYTASAATDARVPGLTPEEASRLRDRLASRGEARLAGL